MSSTSEMDNLVGSGQYVTATDAPEGRRAQSTIQFPYNDLEDAVKVALTIWNNYPAGCDIGQLAGAFRQTPKSGAFRTKVLASKMFGLVQGSQKLTVTPLGRKVTDDRTAAEAKAEAFLRVPLFKAVFDHVAPGGGMLPASNEGLGNLIRELGVVENQVDKARQVFQRSAKQAGYHDHGVDRLVRPASGRRQELEEPPAEKDRERERDSSEREGIMAHPLIVGLLGALPDPEDEFPQEDRDLWIEAAKMNLALIYGKAKRAPAELSAGDSGVF